MFTPETVETLPTKALSDFVTTFEVLGVLLTDVDDCEGFVVGLQGGLETAIHVMDAELQQRHAAPRLRA